MGTAFEGTLSGAGMKIAIVYTRWNSFIVEHMLAGARNTLVRHGVGEDSIDTAVVPGAFELPFIAEKMASARHYDGLVALGCIIRGDTPHFDYIASSVSSGIESVSRKTGIPVSFGVLTTDTVEQAVDRAGTKSGNRGGEAALVTLEMISLTRAVTEV